MDPLAAVGAVVVLFLAMFVFVKFLWSDFGFYMIVLALVCHVIWILYEGFIKKPKDK
jgi:hypothetical protein